MQRTFLDGLQDHLGMLSTNLFRNSFTVNPPSESYDYNSKFSFCYVISIQKWDTVRYYEFVSQVL